MDCDIIILYQNWKHRINANIIFLTIRTTSQDGDDVFFIFLTDRFLPNINTCCVFDTNGFSFILPHLLSQWFITCKITKGRKKMKMIIVEHITNNSMKQKLWIRAQRSVHFLWDRVMRVDFSFLRFIDISVEKTKRGKKQIYFHSNEVQLPHYFMVLYTTSTLSNANGEINFRRPLNIIKHRAQNFKAKSKIPFWLDSISSSWT